MKDWQGLWAQDRGSRQMWAVWEPFWGTGAGRETEMEMNSQEQAVGQDPRHQPAAGASSEPVCISGLAPLVSGLE